MKAALAALVLCAIFITASSGFAETGRFEEELEARRAAQARSVEKTFDVLRAVGEAANAEGGSAAGGEAARQACAALQEQAAPALGDAMRELFYKNMTSPSHLSGFEDTLFSQGQSGLSQALHMGCAALRGEDTGSGHPLSAETLKTMGIALALDQGETALRSMAAPFAQRIELETAYEDGDFIWEALTVVPLWDDGQDQDHVFTQLSWNRSLEDGDTLNAGLAWRRLNETKTAVYGLNAFVDHAASKNHNRMSVGVDAQTSTLGVSANKYIPLSSWKDIGIYQEERAASGWDLELQGRLPEFPAWQANLKGFQWSSNDKGLSEDILGYDATLQWTPVNIIQLEAGVRNEQSADPDVHAALRLVYRFGENIETAWDKPVRLASMEERVYDKVRRENKVRTERRTKEAFQVEVLETAGANTASTENGNISLAVGASLPMPFTLQVSAAGGAIARLRFKDGAILTVGAGSSVRVEAAAITLIAGVFQYISGATNVTINVPGGTVTLLGTDVDVSSDGTVSVLRVRDGSARLAGSVMGEATLGSGEAAESVSGTVAALAAVDANYITHADEVSEKIDRVASAQTGVKIAPYPAAAPILSAAATQTGQTLTIALTFNEAVSVAGGPPQLTLQINGQPRNAVISGGSGTNTLTFDYTLIGADAGANTVTVTGFDANGAAITGNGGKLAVTTIADAVLSLSGPVADTGAPVIVGFAAVSSGGDPADTGDVITVTLNADEDLVQNGAPTLTLDIGGVSRTANFSAINAGNAEFTYTVQVGDNDADGITITAINVAADELEDASGNDLDTSFALPHNLGLDVSTVPAMMLGRPTCPAGDLSPPANSACARLFGADPADIDDVMIYAGDVPGTTTDFFVRRCDLGQDYDPVDDRCEGAGGNPATRSTMQWKNVNTDSDTTNIGFVAWTNVNATDGPGNTATLVADVSGTHTAAETCNALPGGGWYLPAISELEVTYTNLIGTDDPDHPLPFIASPLADDNSGTTGPLRDSVDVSGLYYWSSSERDNMSGAWSQRFGDGTQLTNSKTSARAVRCARR